MFKEKKFLTIYIALILSIVFLFIMWIFNECEDSFVYYKLCVLGSLFVFAIEVLFISYNSGSLINAITIFLASFYVFQNGQLFLYALGIKFSTFYISIAEPYLKNIYLFSSISNILAGFAGLLFSRRASINLQELYSRANKSIYFDISEASLYGATITGIIAIPLLILKFRVALVGGYYAVRSFEEHINSLFGLIEYLFVPFCLLAIVYKSKRNKFVIYIFTVWSILTALCGDRTTGIAGLLIVFYIKNMKGQIHKEKLRVLPIICVGLLGMVMISVAGSFRRQENVLASFGSLISIVLDFISELGFSFFPLYMVMKIIPSSEPFFLGRSYIASFFSGILPASIDPSGTIRRLERLAHSNDMWQSKYFAEFNFGFGYSLNAEAYSNFSWFGLIAIFIVCLFIFYFFQTTKNNKIHPLFSVYEQSILLFSFFTLPRRDTYYLWKAIIYCVLCIKIYIKMYLCLRKNICNEMYRIDNSIICTK